MARSFAEQSVPHCASAEGSRRGNRVRWKVKLLHIRASQEKESMQNSRGMVLIGSNTAHPIHSRTVDGVDEVGKRFGCPGDALLQGASIDGMTRRSKGQRGDDTTAFLEAALVEELLFETPARGNHLRTSNDETMS
eukprot:TRINITY_DN12448_c0_g3_i7.p1 TRINITY_DN12448_c0_g3~~TRINITY_DN12448_c0_g3_i7.p1  ORF type:complete len:144 (+),score=0.49 TRINITY_DN12448_c0_g3_i7:27-434(+)